MVGLVPVGLFGSKQVHRLSDAAWLINRTLFADRQVHGQVQKGVGLTFRELGVEGEFFIRKQIVVFGVRLDPFSSQAFNRIQDMSALLFAIDLAKKTAHLMLGWLKHEPIVNQRNK